MVLSPSSGQKAVANWIFLGVGMLVIQVILGGITRLTGSGLSITEWNVVTGALPPLNEQQWLAEFDKYKQTPQFHLLNTDFTLSNFKFIFFWEWFHRLWARLIAVVFVVGFVWLVAKRYMKASMIKPLLILFLLGAMQGAIGWIMVKSGLTDDMVYVKPVKLALHFVFALVLICYAWWFGLELAVPATQITRNSRIRNTNWLIIVVLFFQLIYGALMAGHKAASAAPTWPTINGQWWPHFLFATPSALVENKITVHFIHRGLAYLLLIATLVFTYRLYRHPHKPALLQKTILWPSVLILVQVALGVCTVLSSPYIIPNHWVLFDWLAQFHQIVALLYLLLMVWMLFLIRNTKQAVK